MSYHPCLWTVRESHQWLKLMGIKEKDIAIFLDVLISLPGLYSYIVSTIINKYQEAKWHSAAFKELITLMPSVSQF